MLTKALAVAAALPNLLPTRAELKAAFVGFVPNGKTPDTFVAVALQ